MVEKHNKKVKKNKMKAKELRIGNETKQGKIISFWESGVHLGMGKTPRFGDLDPIPLTEEWMIKLGFELKDIRFWQHGYFIVHVDSGFFEYKSRTIEIKIDYVHQLQNLYFALTGEELEMK